MLSFKQQIINTCKSHIETKIQSLSAIMQEITNSANNETKSTAGDKHETGRAMMQLEQEKLSKQIADLAQQKTEFLKIDFEKQHATIALGSLIETDKGYFLIATSLGKIEVDNKMVFVISNKSPLSLALVGKEIKSKIEFNQVSYLVKNNW